MTKEEEAAAKPQRRLQEGNGGRDRHHRRRRPTPTQRFLSGLRPRTTNPSRSRRGIMSASPVPDGGKTTSVSTLIPALLRRIQASAAPTATPAAAQASRAPQPRPPARASPSLCAPPLPRPPPRASSGLSTPPLPSLPARPSCSLCTPTAARPATDKQAAAKTGVTTVGAGRAPRRRPRPRGPGPVRPPSWRRTAPLPRRTTPADASRS
ncbi:hypothetical protein BRADI_4g06655v3 [Brachypodium distachyon]|uniref:Uncharacterized protein n=1 Tax=Brachypodium distachyon TaxID=15368 RepID=A0A0Q3PBV1_BRADI|nr:hypothetical protein BRADI_4g06655v3 [Brachypodium distachyon]